MSLKPIQGMNGAFDADGKLSSSEMNEMRDLNNKGRGKSEAETARVLELSKRYLDNEQYNSSKK